MVKYKKVPIASIEEGAMYPSNEFPLVKKDLLLHGELNKTCNDKN